MYSQSPVKESYKLHLMKQVQTNDQKMVYLGQKIRKADHYIYLLEHQLQVGAWSQLNNVDCRNNILIVGFPFVDIKKTFLL